MYFVKVKSDQFEVAADKFLEMVLSLISAGIGSDIIDLKEQTQVLRPFGKIR